MGMEFWSCFHLMSFSSFHWAGCLICFSDNGPAKGTPGSTNGLRGRKGTVYEGGVRVPGIIEWPDMISENRVVHTPIVSSDLLPTVMDILQLEMPDNVSQPSAHPCNARLSPSF